MTLTLSNPGATTGTFKGTQLFTSDFRELLFDDDGRRYLFPDVATEILSSPTAKALRMSVGPGLAILRLDNLVSCRTKISVQHERLPTFDAGAASRQ